MAQFLLLLHNDPSTFRNLAAEERQAAFGKYRTWRDKGQKAGFVVGGNKLTDDSGKVLRGQKVAVSDGPYSETKELLGGYFLIEAANYEEAVRLARDHPHLEFGGTIEVRQIERMTS
jgi:hypothetical protein